MIDIFTIIWIFVITLPLIIVFIFVLWNVLYNSKNKKEAEQLYSFKCTSCGGLDVINANKNKTCKYCGTYHIIQKVKNERL